MPRRPKRNASKTKLQLLETVGQTPSSSNGSHTPGNDESENATGHFAKDMKGMAKLSVFLAMFDNDIASEKTKMLDLAQTIECDIMGRFNATLLKIPLSVKEMKWADYVKQKESGFLNAGEDEIVASTSRSVRFLIKDGSGTSKRTPLESVAENDFKTPAHAAFKNQSTLKSSVVPKFDTSTPAVLVNKRLPKPGEILMSLSGSPIALPTKRTEDLSAPTLVLPTGKSVKIFDVKGLSTSQGTISPASLQQMKAAHKALGQMLKKK